MNEEIDIIFTENKTDDELKKQSILRKTTIEDQAKVNEETEHKTGLLIRIIRIVKENPDIVILGVLVLAVLALGYSFARFYLGLTVKEIKIEVFDFLEFVAAFIFAVSAFVGKLYVKQGAISKALSGQTEKEADLYGKSIISK